MGAGYHGGFGNTFGARYRIGSPVSPTEKSYEMALNPTYYSKVIANKFNIHLKGSKKDIKIVFNPNLGEGRAGRVKKSNPYVIELGPAAFVSESELANTIAHELNHARSYIKGGSAPEASAYHSGNRLGEYIAGRR